MGKTINMKKKAILIITLSVMICFIYWYFRNVNGWMEFRRNTDTPKEFLNHSQISKKGYSGDSMAINRQLKLLLLKRKDFFANTAYSDSMEVIIDSILYSPDFNKLAVFVIMKNSTDKQLHPDKNYDWYYDATCYLGIRQRDSINLNWIGPVFSNSFSRESISNDIRSACFKTFATEDTSDKYKYNLNDIRFWNSPIWTEKEKY